MDRLPKPGVRVPLGQERLLGRERMHGVGANRGAIASATAGQLLDLAAERLRQPSEGIGKPSRRDSWGPTGVWSRRITPEHRRVDLADGELVSRSATTMTGGRNLPDRTVEASWFDDSGARCTRTGDAGRCDADDSLTLMDWRKDMIISGGFDNLPERPTGRAAPPPRGGRSGGGRRAVGAVGRDSGDVRRTPSGLRRQRRRGFARR